MPRFEGKPVDEVQATSRFAGTPISEDEAPAKQAKTNDSYGLNLAREGLQGMTMGFSDEIGATIAAGLAKYLDGADYDAAYNEIVGSIRGEQNAFREANPIASTAAQVVGGVATGGAGLERLAAKSGAKPVGRIAQNAGAGAVAGGTAGAGFADKDKVSGAIDGAKFGAVGGALGGEVGRKVSQKLTQRAEARKLVKDGILSDERTAFLYKLPSGKVVNDKLAREAAGSGIPKPIISLVKAGSRKDRAALKQMTEIKQKAMTDELFASKNNPNQVMGKSLATRIKYFNNLKETAGKEVKTAANTLQGKQVDFAPAVDDFLDGLDSAGIKFKENPDGAGLNLDDLLDFDGSDFEDLEGPMNIISRMVKRMYNKGKDPDAHDVHRLKRYIDENVNYGKNTEGSAKSYAEKLIKQLRHNIDGALDNKFPAYDKANTKFAEAAEALKLTKGALGGEVDLDSKNIERLLGQKGRGLLSNAVYGKKLENAILTLDDVADNYGKQFGDDLHLQARYASSLEEMFGTTQKTSLQGVGENVAGMGAQAATGDVVGAGRAAVKAVKDGRASNDSAAMLSALKKLTAR